MSISEVKVPDIGDFQDVEVIEVICKEGQSVAVEDPLITLESEKATIDVPSPLAGRILRIKIKAGDKVSEGNLILELETSGTSEPVAQKLNQAEDHSSYNIFWPPVNLYDRLFPCKNQLCTWA